VFGIICQRSLIILTATPILGLSMAAWFTSLGISNVLYCWTFFPLFYLDAIFLDCCIYIFSIRVSNELRAMRSKMFFLSLEFSLSNIIETNIFNWHVRLVDILLLMMTIGILIACIPHLFNNTYCHHLRPTVL